jgi:hypothetical protein
LQLLLYPSSQSEVIKARLFFILSNRPRSYLAICSCPCMLCRLCKVFLLCINILLVKTLEQRAFNLHKLHNQHSNSRESEKPRRETAKVQNSWDPAAYFRSYPNPNERGVPYGRHRGLYRVPHSPLVCREVALPVGNNASTPVISKVVASPPADYQSIHQRVDYQNTIARVSWRIATLHHM